jgi:hypothetical protein
MIWEKFRNKVLPKRAIRRADIEGCARCGYMPLRVSLASNLMAMILLTLSA